MSIVSLACPNGASVSIVGLASPNGPIVSIVLLYLWSLRRTSTDSDRTSESVGVLKTPTNGLRSPIGLRQTQMDADRIRIDSGGLNRTPTDSIGLRRTPTDTNMTPTNSDRTLTDNNRTPTDSDQTLEYVGVPKTPTDSQWTPTRLQRTLTELRRTQTGLQRTLIGRRQTHIRLWSLSESLRS